MDKIPNTAKTFAVATLAIAGIFRSPDFSAKMKFSARPSTVFLMWIVGFITAGMTAFYMSRLFFLTFSGYCRADEHVEKHITNHLGR